MYKNFRICATIEARLASTRLPGKVLFPLCGKTTIEHIVERLRRSKYIDDVILATTIQQEDNAIDALCKQSGITCYRGSVNNILERLIFASEGYDIIVQATGDNPFVDPVLVDQAIEILFKEQSDFVCNHLVDSYPKGLEVKVFTREALLSAQARTHDPVDLVHGSYYIYRNPELYKISGWSAQANQQRPEIRLTVDEAQDYILAKNIYEHLYPKNENFLLDEIISYLDQNNALMKSNQHVRQKDPIEG